MTTNSTVAERERLLKIARAAKLERSWSKRAPIEPVDRGRRLPLSFAQQRLWFLEQLEEVGGAYHIPERLRLTGELDREALRRALDRIVARHEALRTTFAEVDGEPEQRIAPEDAGFALVEHDVAAEPDRDAVLRALVAEESAAPFDLSAGPLFRGRLVRMAEDDHVLLLTMHHIVSDGWSLGVLMGELAALYTAFRDGAEDPLPPLPVQYADYAAWQRKWVQGEVLEKQASYWRETLAGAPELLELPADRPRPARVDHAGGSIALELDEPLASALRALGQRHGTTLFMTVLAGWATVLSRLSGQRSVVVGVPTANRGRPEVEGLVGFFVNTLALRLDLSDSPSVAELLARVKARTVGAQQNQDLPFEQIVELVQPVRSLAHHPLFQVMFGWQGAPGGPLQLPGLAVGEVDAPDRRTAKFDLSLTLHEVDGRIAGGMTYAAALFDGATVERYGAYLVRVLEEMAADDARPVDRLTLLAPAERRRVVEGWNATEAAYPDEACVHHLFEAQVERAPEAAAVVFEGGRLTYAELNARANRLARHLARRGVGPDVPVGLCLERGPEMIVAVLAVLKAGGAYVPLDPEYPADRLEYMLADSAPAILLTQAPLAELFAGARVPRIRIDADAEDWAHEAETNPERAGLTPDHLVYVIYTSGSTGRPKGVMNQHRTLVNRLAWGRRAWGIDADEAVLLKTSLSFDGSVREIFLPLIAGARVVIARPGGHRDPTYLLEMIGREHVATINLVPSLLQVLLEAPEVESLRGLRRILCGGEALTGALLERFRERLPGVELHNLYGPSEAATAVASPRCAAEPGRAGVPIGAPIANTRVYVLDGAGEPVPVGVAGELYIGGVPVARGYLGRAAMTAERFVPDPFGGEAGARLYRTGDVARRLADGRLDFVGRNDAQVKVRGFRIELGEIEARLREHGAVREAVVVAREDASGDRRLVAYCMAGGGVEVEALRAHLAERLPEYMVPAAYVRLDALPLTPSGKLDRRALPDPQDDAFARRGHEAPVGETEAALADIWAEVLRVERVGRWDHFFELGGHSLLAVRVISRVRQVLEVEVTLGELFTRPVLRDFARELETAAESQLPPIEPAPREGRVPLSFAQQRLWFLEQLGNLGSTYHIRRRLRLRGELDRAALARALDGIVARHEALRTTFAQADGVPEQRIAPADTGFALVEHELGGRADAEAGLGRLLSEEERAPFDLERGPLIRGRLIRLAEDDHVLLLTMHHIVSDGWSMGVLTHELGALYAAFRRGEPSPLPALEVQYADYAVWQRRWIEGEVLQEQADYWTAALAGAPELLELPTDRPRPARMDPAGAWLDVELDEELTAGLKALGRRHGTTMYMTLLAGWAVVLSRLSGQGEVVVGSPMAGRGRHEIEGLIGFFVNTLALRLDLSDAPTAAELLGRAKRRALEAQHHQDLPFEQVVERVDPARTLAHHPLFQVMLVWQNAPRGDGLQLPGLAVAGVEGATRPTTSFDLTLVLREEGDRIVGGVMYAEALFEGATVERHAGYLRRVLEEMAADGERPVERLALMPESERSRVLEEWNRTEAEYPAGSCIHELFEARAERAPGAVAVVFEGKQLTYGELNRRANRLAHHLRERGVGPDARVAVCLERGPRMVAALLAVLKAGGAYVPLDPAYPAERLAHMLADSAPAAVLTQKALRGRVEDAGVPVLVLDAAAPAWADRPATNPERGALTPAHLAYVIYTSGSTGMPKGVTVDHRAVVNQLAWAQRTWSLGASEAVLQRISFSFDVSVQELFWPLAAGARVVLAGPGGHSDPDELVETITREGIGTAYLIPSLLQPFLEHPGVGACAGLARVMTGGEVLPPALSRRFYERLPGATLYHMYGPTETTVAVTAGSYRADDGNGRAPLGRPVSNTRAYVLDGNGAPVPVGVAGELCIGGAQVARGYLGRPEQTAALFVADAYGGEPGARLYRTGDLVRWRPDGELEFLGRTDQQVKVRGFRIELGEIEARLAEHPGVREAVVLARADGPGGRGEKRLVAYVVGEEAPGAEVLRAHLGRTLPEHMVPAAYVRLEMLPLTPNGKLDRKALPAPEGDAYAAREYEAPVGETEQAVAEIWAGVLGAGRVGRHDHFFELGGHSLLAVQVISRVRQVLEVEVALGELFTRPVLVDFARELETAARAELPPIEPIAREGRAPLSFAQQRLWFLEQLGNLGSTYHIRTRLRLRGELDRGALVRALDGIVARHEALRTTFARVDGVPEQRIAPADVGFALVEHDLGGESEAELDRLMAEEAHAPFDLERGPLIRGRLVRLAADDHVLLVTMHHIVSDGWSMGVLTRELSALYGAFRRGEADPLPALEVQYADYAAWQRRWIDGEVLREQADFWMRTLSGAPELLELPTDHPRPAQMDHAGGHLGVELDEELAAGLKALGRRHGTTLFMTLLAGWATVLGRLSGQDDVVIGTPTAGRGRREIEGLIGFFVSTLAVRLDLSGAPTVAELLGRVKKRALEAQHHQDIPFEQVVERVDPVRSLSHTPLFQATFAWQNAPGGTLEMPGLTLGSVGAADERGAAKQDLSLALGEADGRIVGGVTYATSLFERDTVERWLGYFRRVLEEMVADETRRVERLALLPADERSRVVEEWNRTEAAYPSESCVHQLFEARVDRAPDAEAVLFGDDRLSYAELNARANRLAHHLRSLGVGPDVRVAICVERRLEMVVAVLAVLKAGGAYVPLDPSYPSDRIAYMLADSAPRVVLTQAPLAELFSGIDVPRIRIDTDAAEWAHQPETDPARGALTPEHVAYVIYTSGSTGRPKGVLVPHRGLCNVAAAQQRVLGVGAGDRVLQFASLSFDAAAFELVMALASGAALCVAPREEVLPGPGLLALLRRHAVTTVTLPPSALAALPVEELPALRTITVAGEALPAELVERWGARHRLLNLYGPTEATIWSTMAEVADPARKPEIGGPIANVRAYVLDGTLEPLPLGVPGELYIGGAGVARGYLNRPELTAERFVPDPFGGEAGARLYRTGDRVRRLADGRLDFVGRVDHQVKVRGFRIELGEIEARLAEHPGVREAVVIAREDAPGETRLVAYVVGDEAAGADVLRAHLGETLPEYMVPAAYVHLGTLPLTPNGKLDRRALPAPEGDAFARRGYEAPATEAEAALAGIWAEVLGVERVGRNDGFFELGGHSLLAVTLIERMRRQGLHADVRTLFASPTLAALAAAVGGESAEVRVPANRIPAASPVITPEMLPLVALTQPQVDAVVATVPGGAANVQDIYPLAPLQEGFLFHHLVAAEGDPYLLGTVTGFATREAVDAHLDALRAVVARHDVLRTGIVWEDLPEPVQVVWRQAPLPVEEVDLDPADGDVAEQLYRRHDPRHHRIDIRRAPLMRLHVARDEARERWVLLHLRHHLAIDHTAADVLRDEVEAHLQGRADSLPEPLPFRNFVAQVRLGVSEEEHREFFTELLGDVEEPTAPFGLLDVHGDGSGIDQARLEVDGRLAARLRERARALGVSAATLCHLAWAQVLARVSGRDDVVFGTVLFGRMQGGEGTDRTMGPFINTLPVRIRVGGAGAEASVRRTHELLARLLRHEHASLTLAQRCSAVEAPAPLFTTLLNYRHGGWRASSTAPAAAASTAVAGTRKSFTEERSNYPLTMSVDDLGEAMALTAKVKAQVEAGRVCAMMHTALEGLVQALERAPERPVGSLDVLPADERSRVVEEWNRTEAEFPTATCVHELFEGRAERAPEAVAIVFQGEPLTYGELNTRANRLAHHLRSLGVGPDVRVGICLERSLEMVVGLLGVLKAGGAYVPLDPGYPPERLRYMVEDSAPVVVLTQAALTDRLSGLGVATVALDADAVSWADRPATNPERGALTADHLTHVIYTSGSTGRPKGVMMEHRGGVNRFVWMQKLHRLGVEDTGAMLQNSSFSFDASVWELLWPLSSGARVVLSPPQAHRDLDGLLETIRRDDVRAAFFVPSMLQLLVERGGVESSGLKRVMCGGEALPPALARRLEELLPGVELFNMFGPSEASQAVTGRVPRVAEGDAIVPLGRPNPNTRVYILDAGGAPSPVGVAGEIHVGGVQMARGYLGRPGLTAERFLPDPLSGIEGARLYRTGDLGRWRSDGTIEYLGRMDFQVKVRGFRIELGEIEARLREHAGVREAVVVAREDTPGDKRLVAYWVGEAVQAEALRARLAEALPAYMVPSAYVRMEQFPLSPNGKLERKALPAPEGDGYTALRYEAPVGETEQALAEIWAEVVGADRVGRHDDFFELGGHSLLAVRVISRVRQLLGVEVALGELFSRPVLRDFARELETAARPALPPIEPAAREGRIPLSFAQQRLWFLEQLGGLGSTYHIHKRRRLRGELDRAALVRALEGIVARHEALRTTFVQADGVPEQRIAPADLPFHLVEHDLAGRADADAELDRLRGEEARAPFDLARGPLIRGRLIRLAADDHVLLVTMHHIVGDAWSSGVFFSEFSALYAAHREGREASLPAIPVQYADYAIWQRRWIEGEVLQEQADYWTRTLAGAPELLELPTDHPRPARTDHAGALLEVELDEELTAGLKALSRRHGTTLFMTLLAGWSVVLSRLSGQDEVVIGTPTANRGRREIEGLIGFFINTLALRLDLSGAPTPAELLGRVKERTIEAQHHQDIPFEQVVELVDPVRSLSHNPLFQVNLTWQNLPQGSALALPGLESKSVGMGSTNVPAFVDLGLELAERNGRIEGIAIYATALFERATVERHVGYLRRVLEEMVADESRPVERLALMPADERSRVLEEWNRTEAAYPAGSCIHQLFEAHVERAPDAEAVLFGDDRLSYAQLNARANRIAHHLRSLGVGPDVRVAICVERSPEMVIALLAVLKAGGAYVPLDPAYPAERIDYMLADSAPAVVLTQASLAERFSGVEAPRIRIDTDAAEWADRPETDPARGALTADHVAYVIYTSGSTGRPKGVLVPHRGVCNVAAAQQRVLGVGAGDRVLQFASLSFDAAAFELVMALASGAALCVAPREEILPGPGLLALLRRHAVTTITLPPSALAALPVEDLPALRTITVAGEALPAELVERWGARHRLLNLYGPTEATIWSTVAEASDPARKPDIGGPIANVRAYVLSAALEPLPVGVAGELYVGGVGVVRGYLNRPELTAERFVPDPFGGEAGARLYRTGDRVRRLADGRLDFVGRTDHQVKVRGFRIELGEIESRLVDHPEVREAVVIAREDAPGEKRLVAYVVGEETAGADVLRAYLGETLPEYMVPAAYVRLDALPLTSNGKVDRKALPAPEGDAYAARGYEAPEGETEAALAEIWADVLGIERVGRHDNFFELGGHSLLAVQVIALMREIDLHLDVQALFTAPTLAELAAMVGAEPAGVHVPPNLIVPAGEDDAPSLVFSI